MADEQDASAGARWVNTCRNCTFIAREGNYDVWTHNYNDAPESTFILKQTNRINDDLTRTPSELRKEFASNGSVAPPYDILLNYADV